MIHYVRLNARARAAEAQRALERARANDVALIVPLGAATALAEGDELRHLADYCAAQGKRIVLIGGDQALRARAVAEGFAVATSLEEWETGKQRAVRRLLGMRRERVTRVLPDLPDLRPMAAPPSPEEDSGALYAVGGDDPPEYVAEIAAGDGALADPDRHSQVPTIPLRSSRRAQRLAAAQRERQEAEALLHTAQRYEEQVTSAIRDGAGAGYAPPSVPSGWEPSPATASESEDADDISS
ncbi:MAG TPA: hypothetical protein VID73_00020 [Ktedonobacterales bacterium]